MLKVYACALFQQAYTIKTLSNKYLGADGHFSQNLSIFVCL